MSVCVCVCVRERERERERRSGRERVVETFSVKRLGTKVKTFKLFSNFGKKEEIGKIMRGLSDSNISQMHAISP